MLRDRLKDDKYFENYIVYQNKRIDKFKDTADKIPEADKEKKHKCLRMIANFQKDLFVAKYSAGASVAELKQIFNVYLDILNQIKTNEYAEYVDVMAIGILLDIDRKEIEDVGKSADLNDGLILTLMNYPDVSKKALDYSDYYQPFFDYLSKKADKDAFIKYMSSSWYQSSEEFAWYEADKSKEDIYVGYWCWLAAACLKLRKEKIDEDGAFIPCDLI